MRAMQLLQDRLREAMQNHCPQGSYTLGVCREVGLNQMKDEAKQEICQLSEIYWSLLCGALKMIGLEGVETDKYF